MWQLLVITVAITIVAVLAYESICAEGFGSRKPLINAPRSMGDMNVQYEGPYMTIHLRGSRGVPIIQVIGYKGFIRRTINVAETYTRYQIGLGQVGDAGSHVKVVVMFDQGSADVKGDKVVLHNGDKSNAVRLRQSFGLEDGDYKTHLVGSGNIPKN